MVKAFPHIDQGGGYIRLSRLPLNQSLKLRNWLSQTSLVKLTSSSEVMEDCVEFSEYEYWFDFCYSELEREQEFGI